MKNMVRALIAVLAFTISQQAMAKEQLKIELSIATSGVYKQVSADTYRSEKTKAVSSVSISGTAASGESISYSTGQISEEQIILHELKVLGNGKIQTSDLLQNKVEIMAANISKNEIVVSAEVVKKSISEELKKQGDVLATQISASTEEANFTYNVEVSDMVCKKVAQDLACTLSASLRLNIEAKN